MQPAAVTAAYVFRENLLLAAIGACVGLVMGVSLHMYVMSQIKADAVSFDVNIKLLSPFCIHFEGWLKLYM